MDLDLRPLLHHEQHQEFLHNLVALHGNLRDHSRMLAAKKTPAKFNFYAGSRLLVANFSQVLVHEDPYETYKTLRDKRVPVAAEMLAKSSLQIAWGKER